MCNRLMLKAAERKHKCLRGSELGLLLQSERLISFWLSNAVSACDFRHERMAVDRVPKDLIFQGDWRLLVAS